MRFYGKATPEGIADEKGHYRTTFQLPEAWRGRQILLTFEAVFTDARVTINGRKAGSGLHQGGFTRFQFDVSDRVFFGKKTNRLEVEVSKESARRDTVVRFLPTVEPGLQGLPCKPKQKKSVVSCRFLFYNKDARVHVMSSSIHCILGLS